MLSKDILTRPDVSEGVRRIADELGKKIIHVSLADIPTVENPELTGQTFVALVDFIPAIGDTITAENGKPCKVRGVVHTIKSFQHEGKTEAIFLFPTVYAALVETDA